MRKTVWKFELSVNGNQELELREGYEILALQTQNGVPCLWILINPEAPKEKETFEIYGTGHPINYDMGIDREYVGTWQEQGGSYVWHLFKYTGV